MKPSLAGTLLLALLTSCRAPAEEAGGSSELAAPRYALLPLRNLTADQDLAGLLTARLQQELSARGAEFVPADELERILVARRIRYVDTMSSAAAAAIAEATGATHLVLGTLLAHDPAPPPRIALSMRVIDCADAHTCQSALVALSGQDFTGLLDLGTIEDSDTLAWEVVARAAYMFDERGAPRPVTPHPGNLDRDRPRSPLLRYADATLALEPGERVAILPLLNHTSYPEVGLLFVDVLSHAWLQARGIDTVETGELLEALVRAKVRSVEGLDPVTLAPVARATGARYLLFGSVEFFEPQVAAEDGHTYPELEVWVRLYDVEQGRLVAGAGQRHRGDDYHRMLGLGSERDPVRLALRTARELLATLVI